MLDIFSKQDPGSLVLKKCIQALPGILPAAGAAVGRLHAESQH